jgi:hypothetical protein
MNSAGTSGPRKECRLCLLPFRRSQVGLPLRIAFSLTARRFQKLQYNHVFL